MADRELLHQVTIAAPIEKVWAEITKLGAKQRAMLDSVLDSTLAVGAPLYYKSTDGKRVFVVGRILEIEPPRRLVHTQKLTMRDDPWTTVSWELQEVAGGTQVTLRHTGWTDEAKDVHKVDGTWKGILALLKEVVETGDVGTKQKLIYFMMRTFMFAMPSKTKTENVEKP